MTNVIDGAAPPLYHVRMQSTNTIAEMAIAIPASIPVLERLRIDYCCNEQQSIDQACTRAGISPEQLLTLIGKEPTGSTRSWDGSTVTEIMRFILETHHVYTRVTLQTLQGLAAKVAQKHGVRYPELTVLQRLAGELVDDLLPHMMKEEQILFPYVKELESKGEAPIPFFGTVRNPIRMMVLEHEAAGEKMAEIRAAANDYLPPGDACTSFTAFYKMLSEFENDLHRHIHLENNVLFPRVMALEDVQVGALR